VIRLAVLGATGRTGSRVVAAAHGDARFEVVAQPGSGGLSPGCFADADVVIDFSTPEALVAALPHLGAAALITGTTGVSAADLDRLSIRAEQAPVLAAPNFATGVALLADLVEKAARVVPDYDVEVVESHHRNKADAPSGTALALARAAAHGHGVDLDSVGIYGRKGRTGTRPSGEIGIHALRLGDVVGEHTVWLAGPGERVMLGHVATSRDTFAAGALRAAAWVHGKPPGRYTLRDVLGLER
jgi:4-hydroxy-tetrahydrodipicolinate reductase